MSTSQTWCGVSEEARARHPRVEGSTHERLVADARGKDSMKRSSPGRAWLKEGGARAREATQFTELVRDQLRPVVRAYELPAPAACRDNLLGHGDGAVGVDPPFTSVASASRVCSSTTCSRFRMQPSCLARAHN